MVGLHGKFMGWSKKSVGKHKYKNLDDLYSAIEADLCHTLLDSVGRRCQETIKCKKFPTKQLIKNVHIMSIAIINYRAAKVGQPLPK